MDKSKFRKKYNSKRNELSDDEIESKSLSIANQCLKLDIWNFDIYHIFMPIKSKKEVNTEYLLHILQGKDKNIAVPKSDFDTLKMNNILLTDNTTFEINPYGIPEPVNGISLESSQIQVVFVPLLAFDQLGNRIGYGKGFYDRFFKACNAKTIKVGLSFFKAESDNLPHNSCDIPLDYCVTPDEVYAF
ncbi:MAG: 5-formyltetrahydrofolate cyclo-ligase [Flavobacteriaceae bacterium]